MLNPREVRVTTTLVLVFTMPLAGFILDFRHPLLYK